MGDGYGNNDYDDVIRGNSNTSNESSDIVYESDASSSALDHGDSANIESFSAEDVHNHNESQDSLTVGMLLMEAASKAGSIGAEHHDEHSSNDEAIPGSSSQLRALDNHSISSDTEETKQDRKKRKSKTASALVARETKWLLCSKLLFFLVVLIAAASSAFAVWKISADAEHDSYERRFTDVANAAIAVAQLNAVSIANIFETVSLQITAEELALREDKDEDAPTWPTVHIHAFEARSEQIVNFTQTSYVGITPIVTVAGLPEYQNFVNQHSPRWIKEGLAYSGMPNATIQTAPFVFDLTPQVLPTPARPNENGIFAPLMHVAPVARAGNMTNFNAISTPEIGELYQRTLELKTTVLTPMENITAVFFGTNAPTSIFATPIYRFLDRGNKGDVVAFLSGGVRWIGYLENLLPQGANPVHIVMRDGCGPDQTYYVEGAKVEHRGSGTQVPSIEGRPWARWNLEVSEPFDVLPTFKECGFSLHVFPTQDFYDTIVTDQPFINAVTVVITFFFTAIVFILYDILVERRQKEVIKSADRSNAIVTSLFPANVRDRLMNDAVLGRSSHHLRVKNDDGMPHRSRHRNSQKGGSGISGVFADKSMGSMMIRSMMNSTAEQPTEAAPRTAGGKPIADLFPSATVLFADIVGFTAWSSMREPTQVFELLETLYNTFDRVARRLNVFKVETIGDCYVAATGLPEPNPEHAVVMARFSKHCMAKMRHVVNKLAVTLGPDTGTLAMRCGIHSGPVTAGVLRGDKSRFQLFGDTVNTAARLEQASVPNKIQLSQSTADELIAANRSSWMVAREDKIVAKGKGEMQTYWLLFEGLSSSDGSVVSKERSLAASAEGNLNGHDAHRRHASEPILRDNMPSVQNGRRRNRSNSNPDSNMAGNNRNDQCQMSVGQLSLEDIEEEKTVNLRDPSKMHQAYQKKTIMQLEVQWNVDVLKTMLQKILAMRDGSKGAGTNAPSRRSSPTKAEIAALSINRRPGEIVLDEVQEVIALPQAAAQYKQDPATIELGARVVAQISDFVENIASMYRKNPFHNFSHASHVVQSTSKLMSRIVTANHVDYTGMSYKDEQPNTLAMHRFTYGITSDPVTQFACILAALIHDVDHSGVPNVQLAKEQSHLADLYRGKSVAEQHSLDLAWDLLMEPQYEDFRACIYSNQEELNRFRQLLVNAVMATDIIDKELNNLRKARWEKAFSNSDHDAAASAAGDQGEGSDPAANNGNGDAGTDVESANRMATIVIEHLIQASDVAHTMQHWHVYVKWNEKLFDEIYQAYKCGRSRMDPSRGWYQGELWFFDNYIIPLAKKLKDCGVFGVSSDEYLNYAQANRGEWETRGKGVVDAYMAKYRGGNNGAPAPNGTGL